MIVVLLIFDVIVLKDNRKGEATMSGINPEKFTDLTRETSLGEGTSSQQPGSSSRQEALRWYPDALAHFPEEARRAAQETEQRIESSEQVDKDSEMDILKHTHFYPVRDRSNDSTTLGFVASGDPSSSLYAFNDLRQPQITLHFTDRLDHPNYANNRDFGLLTTGSVDYGDYHLLPKDEARTYLQSGRLIQERARDQEFNRWVSNLEVSSPMGSTDINTHIDSQFFDEAQRSVTPLSPGLVPMDIEWGKSPSPRKDDRTSREHEQERKLASLLLDLSDLSDDGEGNKSLGKRRREASQEIRESTKRRKEDTLGPEDFGFTGEVHEKITACDQAIMNCEQLEIYSVLLEDDAAEFHSEISKVHQDLEEYHTEFFDATERLLARPEDAEPDQWLQDRYRVMSDTDRREIDSPFDGIKSTLKAYNVALFKWGNVLEVRARELLGSKERKTPVQKVQEKVQQEKGMSLDHARDFGENLLTLFRHVPSVQDSLMGQPEIFEMIHDPVSSQDFGENLLTLFRHDPSVQDSLLGQPKIFEMIHARYIKKVLDLIKDLDTSLHRNIKETLCNLTLVPSKRCAIVKAIALSGDKRIVPELVEVLHHLRVGIVSKEVAKAIGVLGDESVVPDLVKILSNPHNTGAGCEMLGVLRRYGDESHVPFLVEMLSKPGFATGRRFDEGVKIARVIGALGNESHAPSLVELLPDQSLHFELRKEIANTINKLGNKRVVPRLISMLSAPDFSIGVGKKVIEIIEDFSEDFSHEEYFEKVLPSLVGVVADPRTNSRYISKPILKFIGDDQKNGRAVSSLAKILSKPGIDECIYKKIIKTILVLNDKRAAPGLVEALSFLHSKPIRTRIFVAIKALKNETVASGLVELLSSKVSDYKENLEILDTVRALKNETVASGLVELLSSINASKMFSNRVKLEILDTVKALKNGTVASGLVELLSRKKFSNRVNLKILDTVGALKNGTVASELVKSIDRYKDSHDTGYVHDDIGDVEVACEIVRTLGVLGNGTVVPDLVRKFSKLELSHIVGKEMVKAIGVLGINEMGVDQVDAGGKVIKYLLKKLSDKNIHPDVLCETAKTIGVLHDKRAAPYLVKLLPNKEISPNVLCEIAKTIGVLGDKGTAPDLVKLLSNKEIPPDVLCEIAKTIGVLGDKRAAPDLVKMLPDKNIHPDVRCEIAKTIGVLGDKETAPDLVKMLSNKEIPPDVLCEIAKTIGVLGDKETAPDLVKLLSNKDINYEVHEEIIHAIGVLDMNELIKMCSNEEIDSDMRARIRIAKIVDAQNAGEENEISDSPFSIDL